MIKSIKKLVRIPAGIYSDLNVLRSETGETLTGIIVRILREYIDKIVAERSS